MFKFLELAQPVHRAGFLDLGLWAKSFGQWNGGLTWDKKNKRTKLHMFEIFMFLFSGWYMKGAMNISFASLGTFNIRHQSCWRGTSCVKCVTAANWSHVFFFEWLVLWKNAEKWLQAKVVEAKVGAKRFFRWVPCGAPANSPVWTLNFWHDPIQQTRRALAGPKVGCVCPGSCFCLFDLCKYIWIWTMNIHLYLDKHVIYRFILCTVYLNVYIYMCVCLWVHRT